MSLKPPPSGPGGVWLFVENRTLDRLDALIDLAQVPPNHDDQAAHNAAETVRVILWENRSRGRIPPRRIGGPAS